jgi:hypothetical protein
MVFESLKLGDLLMIRDTLYKVIQVTSLPNIEHIRVQSVDKTVDFHITSIRYNTLIQVKDLYYIGNIEENLALKLLYC